MIYYQNIEEVKYYIFEDKNIRYRGYTKTCNNKVAKKPNNNEVLVSANKTYKCAFKNDKRYGKYWSIERDRDILKDAKTIKELQKAAYEYIFNGNKNLELITDTIDRKKYNLEEYLLKNMFMERIQRNLIKKNIIKK